MQQPTPAKGIPKRIKKRIPSKLCVRCARVLPLSAFYQNRDWVAQSSRDSWCKNCAWKFCVNQDTLREYCWWNNRAWDDRIWNAAKQKSLYSLSTNANYIKDYASDEKREALENEAACAQFFSMMNLVNYYSYSHNITEVGDRRQCPPDPKEADAMNRGRALDDGAKSFDSFWSGEFTRSEIEYLNQYLEKLEQDFVLDNWNIQDYARKVSLASLNANIKYNLMRQNNCSMKEYKEALDVFDNLCKSANFAECRRKPGESMGLGNLGEIVTKIEQTGILSATKVTFPPDDIDRILHDLSHIQAAVGMEGG